MISDEGDNTKWNNFVESIKSKLTVKQVVDGVRAGGSLTFDYLLLIVTAEYVGEGTDEAPTRQGLTRLSFPRNFISKRQKVTIGLT